MSSVLISIIAFAVALGVLVTVHEFGHFWVARRLGVKVLRFSVGFGKPLWRREGGTDGTEFVVAAVPLGGYVRMLDEREGEVQPADLPRAFNRQPVGTRLAVVAAGPAFNFLLAIVLYWMMFVIGVPGLRPVVGQIAPGTTAAQAGFVRGDEILSVGGTSTPTWDTAFMSIFNAALSGREVDVRVKSPSGGMRSLTLDLRNTSGLLDEKDLMRGIGLQPWHPELPAVLDRVVQGGPAATAGLRGGDRIVSADGKPIKDWDQWVHYLQARPGKAIALVVARDGRRLHITLTPEKVKTDKGAIGRMGAYVRVPKGIGDKLRTEVRHGPASAVVPALSKSWEVTALTLHTLWKMVLGQASMRNISGPLTIAEYAGTSARIGLVPFLGFLAVVSVSLAVLNLLPIPVLDGGHLMYYLIELLKGSPVSEASQALGQRIGIAALALLMGLALYNDLVRLLS